jgi:hypothetical protein
MTIKIPFNMPAFKNLYSSGRVCALYATVAAGKKVSLSSLEFIQLQKLQATVLPVDVEGKVYTEKVYDSSIVFSPSKTIEKLNLGEYNLNEYDVSAADLKDVFRLFSVERSNLLRNMKKLPEFSAYVPLTLNTYKEHYNIQYNQWDKADEKLSLFLGKSLTPLINYPRFDTDILLTAELRLLWLGLVEPTGWPRRGLNVFRDLNILIPIETTKHIANMLFQVHICEPSVRVLNKNHKNEPISPMVLDPWEWDSVPEVIDWGVPNYYFLPDTPPAPEPKPVVKRKTALVSDDL